MEREDDLPETKEDTKTETTESSKQDPSWYWPWSSDAANRVSRELDEEFDHDAIHRIRTALEWIEPDHDEWDKSWWEVWLHLYVMSRHSPDIFRYLEAFAEAPADDAETLFDLFLEIKVWNQLRLEDARVLQRHLRAFIELGFDRHGVPEPSKSKFVDHSYRDVLETWKKFDAPLRERLPVLFTRRGAETMRISLVQLHLDFVAFRDVSVRIGDAANPHEAILCFVDMLGLLARIQVNGQYFNRRGLLVRDPNPDEEDDDE